MEKQVEGRALEDTNIKPVGGEIGPGKGGKAKQHKGIWRESQQNQLKKWQGHLLLSNGKKQWVPDNTLYQNSDSKSQIFIKLV